MLYESRDGIDWRRISTMPMSPNSRRWDSIISDLSVDPRRGRLDVYFAGRTGQTGADLGVRRYSNGRWGRTRVVLRRGGPGTFDAFDLGEPEIVRARGHTYLVYSAMAGFPGPRRIGVARLTATGWQRCGSEPLIDVRPRSWYAQNAIDPSPLVVGDRLYVYFGGGARPEHADRRLGRASGVAPPVTLHGWPTGSTRSTR
jgi:hypothetical protein